MKKSNLKFLSIALHIFISSYLYAQNQPQKLTISEGFENPIGFYDSNPSFSWKISEGTQSQSAYSIVVASSPELLQKKPDIWQSGKVKSNQSIFVKYNGPALHSRQKLFWQVKIWDNKNKPSTWSEVAHFELGLLNNSDWTAKWISLPESELKDTAKNGNYIFKPQYIRRTFDISSELESARLFITAKGVFEAQINGKKVGNDILTPGFTTYNKRIETLTYDVTTLLQNGKNAIGVNVAEGWYAGRLIFNKTKKPQSNIPKILCQLEIKLKNGKTQTIISDANWKVSQNGPIAMSGIYDGESYDANIEFNGWSTAQFDDKTWLNVTESPIDNNVLLTPKRHQTVKNKLELTPKNIVTTDSNAIFDFGQNMVGVPRVKIPMKKDQTLVIRFAEMLNKDGSLYTANYRSAKSTDYYTANKDGVINYTPTFTFHGFRYVEIRNFDKTQIPQNDWVTGLVQYSDFVTNGIFTTSHAKLNQLQSNINWGLRGNFLDIPTDCPQRDERMGWTGDAQVFARTSIYNAEVLSFWSSWLQTMRDDQFASGSIPIIVPNVAGDRVSSGWGDAATIIPWDLYQYSGNIKILADNYPMMKGWIRFYQSKAKNQIVTMSTFGDWLQPYSTNPKDERRGETADELINTAYFAKSVSIAAKTAKVLGFGEDEKIYKSLFDSIKTSFQTHFFDENGKITKGIEAQTGYLLALDFDLLTDNVKLKAINNLIALINKVDNHLRTGFLGTPILAPYLDKIGRADLAYEILFKETYPSWFYSINQGATTMWERWNSYSHDKGFGNVSMNSFNHYAYGAIGQWMYERILGIYPMEPGFKKIRFAPLPGGPLTSAKGEYNSPYGIIKSEWKLENNNFTLNVTIPANTTAQVVLPFKSKGAITVNGIDVQNNKNKYDYQTIENKIVIELNPGTYTILNTK
jgi:alpha-L-rhamnosidase